MEETLNTEPLTYFSDKKVINTEQEENGYTRLTLELPEPIELPDGGKEVAEKISIPEWEYLAGKSDQPTDDSYTRNMATIVVVDRLYDILKGMDVRTEDLSFIIQKFLQKVQGIEEQGLLNIYKVSDRRDIRISHFENLLDDDQK